MKSLHFLYVDLIRSRRQIYTILLFFALAFSMGLSGSNNSFFICCYLIFCAIIMSTQPFNMDQTSESGYLNLLPGSTYSRVTGRYFYGLLLLVMCTAVAFLILAILTMHFHKPAQDFPMILMILFGAALLVMGLQNVVFYAMGRGKSQQWMSIIRMLPAFVLFFGGFFISDYISSDAVQIIDWAQNHAVQCVIGLNLTGIVVFLASINVSTAIIKRRDYD